MKANSGLLLSLSSGVFLVLLIGCAESPDRRRFASTPDNGLVAMQNQTSEVNSNADNSGNNVRDRAGNTLTPGDQGNSLDDRDLTQRIRKSLVASPAYSLIAKNIKIITVNGKVTLRGPVKSESEKTEVVNLARSIAGEGNVEDQLEIESIP